MKHKEGFKERFKEYLVPVPLKDALIIFGLGLGVAMLGRAAIWLPLGIISFRTWLCLAIGVAPLPFLSNPNRKAYLCFVAIVAGAGGMMLLVAGYINCTDRDIYCAVVQGKNTPLVVAISCYAAMLGVGLWATRRPQRKKSTGQKE